MVRKNILKFLAPILILAGLVCLYFGLNRSVTLVIDGIPQVFHTRAYTVGAIVRAARVPLTPQDNVYPSQTHFAGWNQVIAIERARPLRLWLPNGQISPPLMVPDRLPGNLVLKAGMHLFPGDRLLLNGMLLNPDVPLPPQPSYLLQIESKSLVPIRENGVTNLVAAGGANIAAALHSSGRALSSLDRVSPPAGSRFTPSTPITLERASQITVQAGGQEIQINSRQTVGQALALAGISLQGLDYSDPAEDQPIPAGGVIRVVRVKEEVALQQTTIPFEKELVEDPNTELDQSSVIEAGQLGVKVSRVRVRYEDGQETSRQTEAEWTATEPRNEKRGYGTKIVIRTLDTPSGTIEYWRAVTVYATSYSPCGLGDPATTKCYSGTSLGLPVKRGVIGVTKYWYRIMAGQNVYVPGYGPGIIADIGAGIPGRQWIDLGFTDADLELWHQNVILYFLTPVPANVPWTLP